MPSDSERFYWDADVFLSYINGDVARLPDIRALLESAEKGQIQIVTSVMTITEVAFAAFEKTQGQLDSKVEQAIEGIWTASSPVKVVEFHQVIAIRAKDLMREAIHRKMAVNKPADAIHLATAENLTVDALHTYNLKDFARWGNILGFKVEEPQAAQQSLGPMGPV